MSDQHDKNDKKTAEVEAIFDELVTHGWVVVVGCSFGEKMPWIVTASDSIQRRHIVHSDDITAAAHSLRKDILNK
jgi:hypothetical protein